MNRPTNSAMDIFSGPAISMVAFNGAPTATSARAAATSSAAIGCMGAVESRTVSPLPPESAMPPRNSKNCVARTIEYGTPPALIRLSWLTFARMYPLSGMRSAPTTDKATWCPTPAARSTASRLRVDVSKNAITAASSHDGEFVTSTTTSAPASASASPSPVSVLTPEEGEADTASWPRSSGISFLPMSPLPPITTIFTPGLLECRPSRIAGPVLIFPSLFLLFGDDDVLGVLRVQDDGDEARLVLLAGIPADAVQAAGRLVEGVTGLEDLGLVVVDGPLVLALQDVPERRAGVAVRRLHLARHQRHLDRRGLRLLPVQLLDDLLLGEHLDVIPVFALLVVVGQAHPSGRESAHDDRQQGTSHDSSSKRTGASDPSGDKDVEGGTVSDRLEEHSTLEKVGRFAER